jgi:hypothetical protein
MRMVTCERMARRRSSAGGAEVKKLTIADDRDVAGHLLDVGEVVGGEEDGRAEADDVASQGNGGLGIEAGGRLVEEDQ